MSALSISPTPVLDALERAAATRSGLNAGGDISRFLAQIERASIISVEEGFDPLSGVAEPDYPEEFPEIPGSWPVWIENRGPLIRGAKFDERGDDLGIRIGVLLDDYQPPRWSTGAIGAQFICLVEDEAIVMPGRVIVTPVDICSPETAPKIEDLALPDFLRANAGLQIADGASQAELLQMNRNVVRVDRFYVRAIPTLGVPAILTGFPLHSPAAVDGTYCLQQALASTCVEWWSLFEAYQGLSEDQDPELRARAEQVCIISERMWMSVLSRGPLIALHYLHYLNPTQYANWRRHPLAEPFARGRDAIYLNGSPQAPEFNR